MEPAHANANTASTVIVKCALIALVLSGLISQCSAECHRQPLIHIIDRDGCNIKKLPSYGCRGTCTSYSRVSPTDYTQMERSCQCCQEVGHITRRIRLRCPGQFPSTRNVDVRVPQFCTCRPCNGVPSVPSQVRLQDLLQ